MIETGVPTPGAPKSVEDLRIILQDDTKVKVAGQSHNTFHLLWTHPHAIPGIDGNFYPS